MFTPIALSRCGCLFFLAFTLVAWSATRSLADDAAAADEPAAEIESADEPGGGDDAASLERLRNQTTAYRQTGSIRAATEHHSALQSFVIAPDGRIVALVQLNVPGNEDEAAGFSLLSVFGASKGKKAQEEKPAVPACEVRVFSPDGKHERSAAWPVSFMAQTLGLGPDSRLYVAGSGRVARYSLDGSELAIADSPQVTLIEHDRDALREAAEAQIEEEKENAKQMTAALQEQRGTIAAEIEKTRDKASLARLKTQLKQYDSQIKQIGANVAQGADHRGGHGRNHRASEADQRHRRQRHGSLHYLPPDQGLRLLRVAHRSGIRQSKTYRHRTERLLRADGRLLRQRRFVGRRKLTTPRGALRSGRERVAEFGKTGRDGVGASFGGCCNPMNLCFDKGGDLLVSESNGQVKHFTAKGKFVEVTGVARVQPGCKNSAVKVSPDGEQVYYIDVHKSEILILARGKTDTSASN